MNSVFLLFCTFVGLLGIVGLFLRELATIRVRRNSIKKIKIPMIMAV